LIVDEVMTNLLQEVLGTIDRVDDPTFTYLRWCEWPPMLRQQLVECGLLRHEPFYPLVHCDECGRNCVQSVLEDADHPGPLWSYLCPESDLGEPRPLVARREQLQAWRFDAASFPQRMRRLLGAERGYREMVRGRLWELGRATFQGASFRTYLARGAWWTDDTAVHDVLAQQPRTAAEIVLTFAEKPPRIRRPMRIDAVVQIPLTDCLAVEEGKLSLSIDGFAEIRGEFSEAELTRIAAKYPMIIRPGCGAVEIDGKVIEFSPVTFNVVYAMARLELSNHGVWRTFETIAKAAWGNDYPGEFRQAVIDQVKKIRDLCVRHGAIATDERKLFIEGRRDGRYRFHPDLVQIIIEDQT
jgi:hypothetical protein